MLAPEWEASDWESRATAVLRGLSDRLRPDVVEACESMIVGGEWEECADNLLAALHVEGPTITRGEYWEVSALTDAVAGEVGGLEFLAHRREILAGLTVTG
ncbi:hypothetical protein ACIP5Y_25950 [Nocardia sp. NPDC088792]|uniref:hypothetical protein n=1 Tax=Nocardia sp. NPDC088792 TaxID=3364332 RepID=UPI0037F59C6E